MTSVKIVLFLDVWPVLMGLFVILVDPVVLLDQGVYVNVLNIIIMMILLIVNVKIAFLDAKLVLMELLVIYVIF